MPELGSHARLTQQCEHARAKHIFDDFWSIKLKASYKRISSINLIMILKKIPIYVCNFSNEHTPTHRKT